MSKLDQFESAFKSAAKDVYDRTPVTIRKVLVVTDLDEEATRRFAGDVKEFLAVVGDREETSWKHHFAQPDEDVGALLDEVETVRPDLICCYRNLHGRARSYPFSLGAHEDVLTQATSTPVVLFPSPSEDGRMGENNIDTKRVMVLTDHLTGCDRLIDHGVRFTQRDGKLVLAHLEDDAAFERYIGVIGRIPSIDTEHARDCIRQQLLKEPSDYIRSVRDALGDTLGSIEVVEEVRMGRHVADCKQLIDDHGIGLLVMNTKDDEQLAMHGLAYPLAVELRGLPLLML